MAIKKPTVFLDMDGVIVDFDGGVHKKYGIEPEEHRTFDYDYNRMFGCSEQEFWSSLDHDFWVNLEFTAWAKQLLEVLEPYKPCLLTSPARGQASAKQDWIQKNLPEYFRQGRYLIGPGKRYCAKPNAILIDDYDKNIEQFTKAGGWGVLFPAPWNSLHKFSGVCLANALIVFFSVLNVLTGISGCER